VNLLFFSLHTTEKQNNSIAQEKNHTKVKIKWSDLRRPCKKGETTSLIRLAEANLPTRAGGEKKKV
jgi:hypothetical protein